RAAGGAGGAVGVSPEAAFHTDVRTVPISDFQKNDFDEHLRSRAVQIAHHLADVLTGLVIRDDHEPPRIWIDGDHRVAHLSIAVIIARTTGGARPPLTGGPAPAGGASLLRVNLNYRLQNAAHQKYTATFLLPVSV